MSKPICIPCLNLHYFKTPYVIQGHCFDECYHCNRHREGLTVSFVGDKDGEEILPLGMDLSKLKKPDCRFLYPPHNAVRRWHCNMDDGFSGDCPVYLYGKTCLARKRRP